MVVMEPCTCRVLHRRREASK